jgi:hypothetical protein
LFREFGRESQAATCSGSSAPAIPGYPLVKVLQVNVVLFAETMDQVRSNEPTVYTSRQTYDDGLHNDGGVLAAVIDIPINKNRIVTRTPEEPFRLTFIDTTCLVINRTIGKSSIFTVSELKTKD